MPSILLAAPRALQLPEAMYLIQCIFLTPAASHAVRNSFICGGAPSRYNFSACLSGLSETARMESFVWQKIASLRELLEYPSRVMDMQMCDLLQTTQNKRGNT